MHNGGTRRHHDTRRTSVLGTNIYVAASVSSGHAHGLYTVLSYLKHEKSALFRRKKEFHVERSAYRRIYVTNSVPGAPVHARHIPAAV